ncbi:PREDICTED: monocarboxylate transporter 9 isoform X1 [Drosophila arizonae]|uniref:Monocarboxylate transporter 9 isoform X1 n=1 Tax=Drosophila arizonae TaxID=7263 RepID=A0ABM1PW55_DROAR|nr:PREDICTED: monocarboxylate transporter 9 isoform X1 [Drosophila arizonae]
MTAAAPTAPTAQSKSYQWVAPDGGWGILVCIGMALPFISGLAALPSFGLIFGDFLKSIGAETSAIAIITSSFFCSLSFAGLFSGSLFRKFGMRPVGLAGGILYFVGTGMQVFANTTLQLTFAFSLLQGTGFGLIIPTSYTSFNNYFVKNRVMWMSFAQSLIGLGSMVYPILMQMLMQTYGFRGCLLVLTGINAHAVLGMLLMHPVEWHMRRVPVEEEAQQLQPIVQPTVVVHIQPETPLTPIPELDFGPKTNGGAAAVPDSLPVSRLGSRRVSHVDEHMLKLISSRSSSITSLGNWSGPIVVTDASPQMQHSLQASRRHSIVSDPIVNAPNPMANASDGSAVVKRSCWGTIADFLDLPLLKQPIYVNIVLGITFALYSDIAFFTIHPSYLFELGYSKPDTANIIAIGAAADLLSRIFLAITAIFIQVPARYIYLAGSLFTVFTRFAFNGITDFVGMACITAVLGFLRTWIHVPLPLVFADYLPKDRFASGYGLFMFTQGNAMFIIGPIVGYIRDRTQDYLLVFHILNVFMALCAVPWIIEILCVKFRRRNKLEQNNVCEHDNGNNRTVH